MSWTPVQHTIYSAGGRTRMARVELGHSGLLLGRLQLPSGNCIHKPFLGLVSNGAGAPCTCPKLPFSLHP